MATRVCSAAEYIWLVKGTATQQIDGKPERLCDAGWRSHKQALGPPPRSYGPFLHCSEDPFRHGVATSRPEAARWTRPASWANSMGQWLLHGGGGYTSGGCSITVPRAFSRHGHGKVLHGPHTEARGLGDEGQLHVQLGRPLLKSIVSNLLIFLSRPLGITARTRLWNEGRCPVSERVSHVDAILLSVS